MAGIATHFGARKTPYYQNREMLKLQSQAAAFDPNVNHLGQKRVGRRVVAGAPQRTVAGQDFTYGIPSRWSEEMQKLSKRRNTRIPS